MKDNEIRVCIRDTEHVSVMVHPRFPNLGGQEFTVTLAEWLDMLGDLLDQTVRQIPDGSPLPTGVVEVPF